MVVDESCLRRKELGRGRFCPVACTNLEHDGIGDGTPDTPSLTPPHLQLLSGPSTVLALSLMARFLLCLSSLFLFFNLVSSHLIEVPASKKECFFEDLHINDQVLHVHLLTSIQGYLAIVPDDSHVSGWRRRPLGH